MTALTVESLLDAAWDGEAAFNELRAQWTTAFINDLADSAFAYIEPGGEKDDDGKTTPRSLRHFPHHGADGKIDLPHLRNALSRAPQSPFGDKAMPHLNAHAKAEGIGDRDDDDRHSRERIERRAWPLAEVRLHGGDDGPKIGGYAAVFNAPSETLSSFGMTFIEVIRRGAFSKTLQEADIRALVNHDPNYVLGRNKADTLQLTENRKGLAVEIDPPDTQWARDLMTSMKRGDVTQMSFAFQVLQEKWTENHTDRTLLRELQEVQLYDVSVVTFPAYPDTSAVVRSLYEEAGINLEDISSVLLRARAGVPPSCEDGDCLRAAIAALTERLPREPAFTTPEDPSLLRYQLDLMERSLSLARG